MLPTIIFFPLFDPFYFHIQCLHIRATFWKRRTNESNLEWRIPRWSVTFLGCRLVIVTIPVHLSLAGTSLLILGGPARPPCQQPAPLGNNLCLMNKHIWDLPGPCPGIVIAKLVSSGIQIICLVPSPPVKVQLSQGYQGYDSASGCISPPAISFNISDTLTLSLSLYVKSCQTWNS